MPGPHRRVLRVLPRGASDPAPASGVRKPQRGPHAVRGGVSQRPQPTKPPDGARPPWPVRGRRPAQHPGAGRGRARAGAQRRGASWTRAPGQRAGSPGGDNAAFWAPTRSPRLCVGFRRPGRGERGVAGRGGAAGPGEGSAGRGRAAACLQVGPARRGLRPAPGPAADGAPAAGSACMGLPRGLRLWLLVLLAAAGAGIFLALLSSAGKPYPGPRAGAR